MMRLGATQFERRLRSAARRELRKSEELLREYRQRTRWNWLRRLWRILVRTLVVVFTCMYAPLALSMILFGFGRLVDRGSFSSDANPVALLLSLNVCCLTGIVLLIAGFTSRAYFFGLDPNWNWQGVIPMWDLRTLAHLPIADNELQRTRWLDKAVGAWLAIVFCSIPYIYVGWHNQLAPGSMLGGVALWCLHILSFGAAVVMASAFSPLGSRWQSTLTVAGMTLLVGSLLTGFVLRYVPADAVQLIQSALYVSPVGWVTAAFWHGLVQHNIAAWLWLIPAELFIVMGVVALRMRVSAGFSIKEFVTSGGSDRWFGVIENGFRVPRELPPLPYPFGTAEQQSRGGPLLAIDAERRIHSSDLCGAPLTAKQDWLGRLVSPLFSKRESLLLSLWSGWQSRLGSQLGSFYLWLAALVILQRVFVQLGRNDSDAHDDGFLLTSWWPLLAWVSAKSVGTDRLYGARANLLILYPVDFTEVCRASLKLEIMRGLVFAPALVGYAVVCAYLEGRSTWALVTDALFLPAVAVCAQPVVDCLKLSSSTNDTKRVMGWVVWIGGGGAYFAAAMSALVMPSVAWRGAALACSAVVSAVLWLWYRSAYHRGKFDLLVKPYVIQRRALYKT